MIAVNDTSQKILCHRYILFETQNPTHKIRSLLVIKKGFINSYELMHEYVVLHILSFNAVFVVLRGPKNDICKRSLTS